jgi:hypothetical protein
MMIDTDRSLGFLDESGIRRNPGGFCRIECDKYVRILRQKISAK